MTRSSNDKVTQNAERSDEGTVGGRDSYTQYVTSVLEKECKSLSKTSNTFCLCSRARGLDLYLFGVKISSEVICSNVSKKNS